MVKLKKIAYYVEDSAPFYIPKRIIDLLNKKTIILNQYVDEDNRKLVIEYKAKKGSAHGRMVFYDMGPEEENIKEEK